MMETTISDAPVVEGTASPSGRLYSPGQILLASCIGGPLAAGWFFARNERALGEPRRARWWLVGGALGMLAVIALAYLLPPRFPNGLPLAYSLGLYLAARQMYGAAVARHKAASGRLGSWWAVLGISVVFLLLVLALIVLIELVILDPRPRSVLQGPVAIRR